MNDIVLIEAALNGGRSRREQPNLPITPAEIAGEARRCADAGAQVVHIHAQDADGHWSADLAWYQEAHRRIREAAPGILVSLTSIRPADQSAAVTMNLFTTLAADSQTKPDLISVNLGHITAWETVGNSRRTISFPNTYEEIAALLSLCQRLAIVPELGVMDLGFISNAVALRDDGLLPMQPWFLIELDTPTYGAGRQVAPSTVENYDFFAQLLRDHFPAATWAGHGNGVAGYAVLSRALETGGHIRVGFEDTIHLPDGTVAQSNATVVDWAVAAAHRLGRVPATIEQARRIIGIVP